MPGSQMRLPKEVLSLTLASKMPALARDTIETIEIAKDSNGG